MSAPVGFFSGAPAAQNGCATGNPDTTYITQRRKERHCAFASGAAQQAGVHTSHQCFRPENLNMKGMHEMEDNTQLAAAKVECLKRLRSELIRISDELHENDISAMKILGDHIRAKLQRDEKTGRMMKMDVSK